MRLSGPLFLLLASLLFAFAAKAQAPLFDEVSRNYNKGHWTLPFQSTFYKTTANYSFENGETIDLPDGSSYDLLSFDFGARWNPTSQWGLYLSSQVANATSEDPINVRKNSSLTQVMVGADMKWLSWKDFELLPDFSFLYPLDRIETVQDEVLNSEGAMEITARLIGRFRYGSLQFFGFSGATYRDEGRSAVVPFGVGFEQQWTKWALGSELRGYQTVINDKYTDTPQSREILAAKNGGSLRFYAVDPSILDAHAWLKRQVGIAWSLKMGGGASLTGANTAAGWNVFAGLSYSFDFNKRSWARPAPPDETYQFREETEDGVNQRLFRVSPPPPVPPPTSAPTVSPANKTAPPRDFKIKLKSAKPSPKNKKRSKTPR